MDSDLFMQNEPNSGVVGDGTSKGWSCRKLARRQARPTQDREAQNAKQRDGTLQQYAGRVRKRSGLRVTAVLWSFIIDVCSFSGKASPAVHALAARLP
jgi:hypothetical protein